MQPKHVKEAFRLLNKSIIRVEQPVINFEEEEEEGPAVGMYSSTLSSIDALKCIFTPKNIFWYVKKAHVSSP